MMNDGRRRPLGYRELTLRRAVASTYYAVRAINGPEANSKNR